LKSRIKLTNKSSKELICIWRRTASQAASGAYPIAPDVDGPLLVEVVDGVVFVFTIVVVVVVVGIGLGGFNFACRKANSEQ